MVPTHGAYYASVLHNDTDKYWMKSKNRALKAIKQQWWQSKVLLMGTFHQRKAIKYTEKTEYTSEPSLSPSDKMAPVCAPCDNLPCLLVPGRNRSCRSPTKSCRRKRGRRASIQVRLWKYRNTADLASCSRLPTLDVLAKMDFQLNARLLHTSFIRTVLLSHGLR